jgi:hypothetical protein
MKRSRFQKRLLLATISLVMSLLMSSCGGDSGRPEFDSSNSPAVSPVSSQYTSPGSATPYTPPVINSSRKDAIECSPGYWYEPKKYPFECFNLSLSVSLGDPSGVVSLQGVATQVSKFSEAQSALIKSARLNSGDRDWNLEAVHSPAVISLAVLQGSSSVVSSAGKIDGKLFSIQKTTLKMDVTKAAALATFTMVTKYVSICVTQVSSPLSIPTSASGEVSLHVTSLVTEIFEIDCLTPLQPRGGAATITQTIAPGASKAEVSAVMGVAGLTVLTQTSWRWSAGTPGCIATIGPCSVTFDATGRLSAILGVKATYLTLSQW